MRGGQGRRTIVESWSPPSDGQFKFNIDNATKGKLGLARIGVVVHNSLGEIVFYFWEPIGIKESNKVELLAIRRAQTYWLVTIKGS